MKLTYTLILTLFSVFAFAQSASCDGTRYKNFQFVPDTTLAIQFGNATTVNGVNQDLFLDFFEPAGDVAVSRPLIIFAFGGSFIGGDRTNMHSLCAYFAAKGYATAAIDYRLYDGSFFPIPDSVTMADEVIKAVSDMKASVRFFREDAANANIYKVDTNLIFVGGISAGGIVADHVGLLQPSDNPQTYIQTIINNNGGWSGNSSTNTQHGSDVAGVINYSGALKMASYIDANDPPLFSVHDDQDGTVPYGTGSANIFGIPIITLQGSSEMKIKADAAGIVNELITIPNSTGHVSYFNDQVGTDSILARTTDFLFPLVCAQMASVESANTLSELKLFPNPVSEYLQIELTSNENHLVKIIDLSGRVVYSKNVNTTLLNIDMSKMVAGTYVIEVTSAGAKYNYNRKKIIKL